MATFLQRQVLGSKNVTGIYVLEPMTHLQTTNNHPDMAAPETVQQFALLNHITLPGEIPPPNVPYTGNSYPLNASYASAVPLPTGVATPAAYCPSCQGLDFSDQEGDNETLVTGIVKANVPGFYVFSAPWETTSGLMANINKLEGYNLTLPASYAGPNYIYAISIAPSGSASLVTFNTNLHPPSTYPVLPAPPPVSTPCAMQSPSVTIEVPDAYASAVIPENINKNETLYIIRHADAHPQPYWSDGNYVCAGQWRALDLPNALRGKISPQQVYSSDPAQISPGFENPWSGVAPSLTVEPYAIANNLPYDLAASFDTTSAQATSEFFFNNDTFSGKTVLLAWSYQFIKPTVDSLISSYFQPNASPMAAPAWPPDDYDTVWKVTLDAGGNLTVNNATCEGIDSAALPATCPRF